MELVVDVNVLDAVLVYTVSGVAGILCSLGESDLKNPKLGERYSKIVVVAGESFQFGWGCDGGCVNELFCVSSLEASANFFEISGVVVLSGTEARLSGKPDVMV